MKKILLTILFISNSLLFANNNVPSLFIQCDTTISSDYVEASFKFIDVNEHVQGYQSTENFENTGFIRIRGNSTATSPKKPYNIKFDTKINFLGMGKSKKWALLSNPFDPSLIRNKLIFDLAGKLPFNFSPKSYFVDVWLNGSFIGNYQLTQNIEFQKTRIPYDIENGDFLFERVTTRKKSGVVYVYSPIDSIRVALDEPETPTEDQLGDLQTKLNNIETAIGTYDINEYIKYVDLQTMIDYYWIEEFVNDPDLHTGSVFFTIHDGLLRGGPVWDFDLALGNTKSASKSKTTNLNARDIWWAYLFKDPLFEKIANERYLELSPYFENMAKDNELGGNQIDSLVFYFSDSFKRNYSDSGWAFCDSNATEESNVRRLTCPYNPQPAQTFEENIEMLRAWIISRNNYLLSKAKVALENLDSIDVSLKEILDKQDSILGIQNSDCGPTILKKNFPLQKLPLSTIPSKTVLLLKGFNLPTANQTGSLYLINGKANHTKSSGILIRK